MTNSADHKTKMQAVQAAHRKKQREVSDPGRGLVLIHSGNGKGKSSSAFGVAIRALGWGKRVGVVQFIKGKWVTGERQFFNALNALVADQPDNKFGPVTWYTMGDGFTWDTQDKDQDTKAAILAFEKAVDMMASGDFDVIILDEINIALRYDYLTVDAVLEGLKGRAQNTSVVLTGRDAKPEICDYADLVSDIAEIKHPYKAGIKAQKGLDY
ncbi:MAG: cob(I)yrinic acid a,c-diamide adenosyltransferase [Pseudomonadota bacterium]